MSTYAHSGPPIIRRAPKYVFVYCSAGHLLDWFTPDRWESARDREKYEAPDFIVECHKPPSRYPPIRRDPVTGERLCRGCGGPIPKRRQTWCSNECYEKYMPDRVFDRVFKRDGGTCQRCGYKYGERPLREFHYDHIIPFSEGGAIVDENIRLLCEPCHKARTREWHRGRARQQRQEKTRFAEGNKQLPLL